MATEASFKQRLIAVIVPTKFQTLMSVIIALVVLEGAQVKNILPLIGVSKEAANATWAIFHTLFGGFLTSQFASSTALVTFWASVGLVAYLVCWAAYNVLIEARNEVTLETQYTNRGHWRGPLETLALKAVGAAIFVGSVALLLGPGFMLWNTLADGLTHTFSVLNALAAVVAIIGLSGQLYLVFAFVLLTITPWYRPEAFTAHE